MKTIYLILALILGGQNPSMHIKTTGRSDISIEAYDSTKHHVFEPTFTNRLWAPMRPYAVVLHNGSNRTIKGLNMRWTYLDRDGKRRTADVQLNSFTTGSHGTSPGKTLLVVPGASMSSDLAGQPSIGGAPSMEMAEKLLFSPETSVELDTAIFDDGEVIGPDQSRFVDSLIAQDAALKMIGNVLATTSNPHAALGELVAKHPPRREETATDGWIRRLAKVPPDLPLAYMQKAFERHPLPHFYRKPNNN
jgi:hypothetical protein